MNFFSIIYDYVIDSNPLEGSKYIFFNWFPWSMEKVDSVSETISSFLNDIFTRFKGTGFADKEINRNTTEEFYENEFREDTKLLCDQSPQVTDQLPQQGMREWSKYYLEEMQPLTEEMQPLTEEMQPLTEEIQPLTEEIQPLTEEEEDEFYTQFIFRDESEYYEQFMNEGYQEAIAEIQEGNDESQQRAWNRNFSDRIVEDIQGETNEGLLLSMEQSYELTDELSDEDEDEHERIMMESDNCLQEALLRSDTDRGTIVANLDELISDLRGDNNEERNHDLQEIMGEFDREMGRSGTDQSIQISTEFLDTVTEGLQLLEESDELTDYAHDEHERIMMESDNCLQETMAIGGTDQSTIDANLDEFMRVYNNESQQVTHQLPQQRTGDMSFLNGVLGNLEEENEKFYTQFRVKSYHDLQEEMEYVDREMIRRVERDIDMPLVANAQDQKNLNQDLLSALGITASEDAVSDGEAGRALLRRANAQQAVVRQPVVRQAIVRQEPDGLANLKQLGKLLKNREASTLMETLIDVKKEQAVEVETKPRVAESRVRRPRKPFTTRVMGSGERPASFLDNKEEDIFSLLKQAQAPAEVDVKKEQAVEVETKPRVSKSRVRRPRKPFPTRVMGSGERPASFLDNKEEAIFSLLKQAPVEVVTSAPVEFKNEVPISNEYKSGDTNLLCYQREQALLRDQIMQISKKDMLSDIDRVNLVRLEERIKEIKNDTHKIKIQLSFMKRTISHYESLLSGVPVDMDIRGHVNFLKNLRIIHDLLNYPEPESINIKKNIVFISVTNFDEFNHINNLLGQVADRIQDESDSYTVKGLREISEHLVALKERLDALKSKAERVTELENKMWEEMRFKEHIATIQKDPLAREEGIREAEELNRRKKVKVSRAQMGDGDRLQAEVDPQPQPAVAVDLLQPGAGLQNLRAEISRNSEISRKSEIYKIIKKNILQTKRSSPEVDSSEEY